MVSAVPNLTCLTGEVAARRPHPDLDGWDLVTLAVQATAPVEEVADLLGRRVGQQLPVAVRRELLGEAAVGDVLSLRARLTPAGAVAENRPAAGDFTLTHPPPGDHAREAEAADEHDHAAGGAQSGPQ